MTKAIRLEQLNMQAREEDVATLDGIIKAFYDVISGPAGESRDWDRDRTLYVPGGLFVPTGRKDGVPSIQVLDHEAYIERSGPILSAGFFEQEINRVTRIYGNIAHVFSTYEARRTKNGPVMIRGVNSIQLVNDGRRWWIVSAAWDTEREDNPLPVEFLPEGERS